MNRYGLYLAWLVSLVATGGSLYFSEVLHFVPCQLCWFQRIMMYPQVILLGIASYRNDLKIASYVLPMNIIGWLIALYHYFVVEQKVFGDIESPFCQPFAPCDATWIEWFSFITIPFMSLTAFTLITLFMFRSWRSYRNEETEPEVA